MNRLITTLFLLVLILLILFTLAAIEEVNSLKSALTKTVRHFRGAAALSLPSMVKSDKPSPKEEIEGEDFQKDKYKNVSFSLTEENLNRMLSRQKVFLNGSLIWQREASSRLADGNITVNSFNTLHAFGVKILQYPGFSDWTLAVHEDGIGIKLNDLRIMNLPVPFSTWLFSLVSGRAKEDWVYLRIPARQIVEKVEIYDGKLMVSGKIR
jgi:hypothetical protein